jgi:hypothetical protein
MRNAPKFARKLKIGDNYRLHEKVDLQDTFFFNGMSYDKL